MQFELRHVLDRPPDIAFGLVTSSELETELDAELRLDKTLLDRREHDDGIIQRWRVIERGDKPAFIQKIVGPAFEYTLEHRTERSRRRTTWKVTPSVGADRVRAEGYELIDAHEDPGRSVRVVWGVVEVDAPVFGKRLADFIGAEVEKGYARAMPALERWVRAASDGSP
jgi:hypothetical protein